MTWEEVELRSGQRISVTTDVREAIKRRPEMYLDAARYDRTRRVASEWGMTDCASDEDFAALELVRGLVWEALLVHGTSVGANRLAGWWVVTSSEDWLTTPDKWTAGRPLELERSAFESMPAAFPITREVIVAALATDVVTSSVPCGLQVIKGTSDAVIEDFLAAHEHARAVAFRKIDLSESKWDRSRASGPWAETGPDS